jgi:ferrous iron transport protein B
MKPGPREARSGTSSKKNIVLLGNPNVGKSVIFNFLTGTYVTVSNYPGTTVEVTRGTLSGPERDVQVVDTPGVNSLIPMSEDEKVTRDILLNDPPTSLIQVIDAKNIRRGLLISLQLLEMEIPFLVVLNMWDEAKTRGIEIQTQSLSAVLGTKVLKTVATRRKGLDRIRENLDMPRPGTVPIVYPEPIERAVSSICPLLPGASLSKRSLALMLHSGDETLTDWLHQNVTEEAIFEIERIRRDTQSRSAVSVGYLINQARLRTVDDVLPGVMSSSGGSFKSFSVSLGYLSIHPFWGIPILLLVLLAMYEFVGVFGAKVSVDFLEGTLFGKWMLPPLTHWIQRFLPIPILQGLLVGPYGLFTMALKYAIAIVLPIVGYFFLIFGVMEDSGYLPRLAVMTNRILKKMGLNGKAVLPMVLGLGCDTMATMTTRILETEKDRAIVTLLLALGVPCSAQLGVILGMFAGLPIVYLLIWVAVIAGILVAVGYLASRVLPGAGADFILEIPPLRVPQLSNVIIKTLARIEWYLKEAVPLFVVGTLVLFLLHETKALAFLEWALSPVITHFLGLPSKVTEAFVIGFLRRDYGAAGLFELAKEGKLNPHQILVGLVTMTLFIPCIAQFFMMIKERGLRRTLWITAVIMPLSLGVGGVLHWLLRWLGV